MKRLILGLVLILAPATALAQPADNKKPAPPPEEVPVGDAAGAPAEEPPVAEPAPPELDPVPTPMPEPVPPPVEPTPVEATTPEPVVVPVVQPATAAAVAPDNHPAPSRYAAGLKGGVNVGTQSGSGANDASTHFGMCLGAFATYELSSALALHGEVLMSDKGADYTDVIGNDADEAIIYVELPVFARYNLSLGERLTAFGFGGPSVAYIVDSKNTMKDDLKPLDVAVAAGAGLDIHAGGRTIAVDVRFSQGLLNILDNGSGDTIRNRLISLYAGVTL